MPKSQASEKQLAANRANALKSTGPRTPEGKARSSQNSRKHGFAAHTIAAARRQDLRETARLKAGLLAVYRPLNSQELFAIDRLALAQQALLRAARLETSLFTTCLDEALCDPEIGRVPNLNSALGEGFHGMAQKSNAWTLFLRYQAQAERNYRRAVDEFERLKALRPELPNEPAAESQPEENTEPRLVSLPSGSESAAPELLTGIEMPILEGEHGSEFHSSRSRAGGAPPR